MEIKRVEKEDYRMKCRGFWIEKAQGDVLEVRDQELKEIIMSPGSKKEKEKRVSATSQTPPYGGI